MKKFLSALLASALLLLLGVMLASCAHECEFSEDWSKDESSHWHACEVSEKCEEITDKAEHTWNEGKVTVKATPEAEGTKVYACKVCGYEKTEVIPKCEFSAAWSMGERTHWHACLTEDCTSFTDETEHTWNKGQLTTPATADKDGVKTFACTICGYEKTEAVPFTGYTRTQWSAALNSTVFENFTYTEKGTVESGGVRSEVESVYKFEKSKAWIKMTMYGETFEEYLAQSEAKSMREDLVSSIKDIASYSNYEYDAATRTYKSKKAVYIESLGLHSNNVTLKFENDKLTEIKFNVTYVESGTRVTIDEIITITDYGTTVVGSK
ncbi:MAG: hypothetical protein IJX27_08385 [Clostridia bacterium]|nr:hypothetical protein [Clostridia bacterium]